MIRVMKMIKKKSSKVEAHQKKQRNAAKMKTILKEKNSRLLINGVRWCVFVVSVGLMKADKKKGKPFSFFLTFPHINLMMMTTIMKQQETFESISRIKKRCN